MATENEQETAQADVLLIAAAEIRDTGKRSWKFVVSCGAPHDLIRQFGHGDLWGFISLDAKGPGYLAPFKLARREEGAVGDNGVKRWSLNIFNKDDFVLVSGADADEEQGDPGLVEMIKEDKVPGCILLVSLDLLDRVEAAFKAAGRPVEVFECDHALSTS